MRTPEELKKLAIDIRAGKIWTDRDGVESFRAMIALSGEELHKKLVEAMAPKEIDGQTYYGMMYEYLDKAGPLAINGMPMFLSFAYMTAEELHQVVQIMNKLQAAEEAVGL